MNAGKAIFAMVIPMLAATGASAAPGREAPVAVDVAGLQRHVAAAIEKHAEGGLAALNRYLTHTRRQHGLALEDVVRRTPQRLAGAQPFPAKEYRRHAADWR